MIITQKALIIKRMNRFFEQILRKKFDTTKFDSYFIVLGVKL